MIKQPSILIDDNDNYWDIKYKVLTVLFDCHLSEQGIKFFFASNKFSELSLDDIITLAKEYVAVIEKEKENV